MGNTQDKPPLRKALSVPDTHALPPDAPVLYKEKSRSSQRLYQPNKGGNGKQSKSKIKKSKQQKESQPEFQLAPSEAAFLPAFPLRGDLEDLDFEVIEVIAKGAYGNVIKVQREDDKRFYATKILSKAQILQEGAVRQCKDEASIQSMAGQHPFVVKAYEYWQSHTNLYLVLEYVPHGDMFTLWTFHGAFPEDLVRLYIAEMSLVLDYLHSECVIYRDIKMENILFDAMGHIQLTDFGLAKWLQSGDNTRTVCGTLQYMAPEVLSVYPYGHPADWWSVGILMYTMLAGRYPVDGMDTHTRMAQKVFECDYLLPSNISDSAQDVINRFLTKSPHKRLCDLYHLQDLHFFQDLIFSDLTDGKINPVDVVPPDFFPMTGASWAPYVFSEEDNKQFEEFDDTNTGYNDDYASNGYKQQDQHPPYDPQSAYNNHSQNQHYQTQGQHHQRNIRHDIPSNNPDSHVQPQEAKANSYSHKGANSYDVSSQPQDTPAINRERTSLPNEAARAYPQPADRPKSSLYNDRTQAANTYNVNRDSSYFVENYDGEPKRRDMYDNSSSHSDLRGAEQMPSSSISYNHSLPISESYQSQAHSTYVHSSSHQSRDNRGNDYEDSRFDGGHRRGSKDSYLAATNEQTLHSSPSLHYSSQLPTLPQKPPPPTFSSQQPFSSPSHALNHDKNVFKQMEPAPTITLTPKNINSNVKNKTNNNFMQDSYNLNTQMEPRVLLPPSSATIVTSPTAKIPPSNRMSGYGHLEEAKIELPTSPVVMSPSSVPSSQPNKFVLPPVNQQAGGSKSLNRFQPPQPPPQSAKPRHALQPNEFHLNQPPSKPFIPFSPQVTRPQPPPQASKPSVHPKPSVAPKPSAPPKANATPKPNVLAPVPAVRKSFNTKKSHKPRQIEQNSGHVQGQQPISLHTDDNFNNATTSSSNVNHLQSSFPSNGMDLTQGLPPQDNPRPVPRPRPRQTIRSNPGEATPMSLQVTNPDRVVEFGTDRSGDDQEPQSPDRCQWNLPTSAVPHFV